MRKKNTRRASGKGYKGKIDLESVAKKKKKRERETKKEVQKTWSVCSS